MFFVAVSLLCLSVYPHLKRTLEAKCYRILNSFILRANTLIRELAICCSCEWIHRAQVKVIRNVHFTFSPSFHIKLKASFWKDKKICTNNWCQLAITEMKNICCLIFRFCDYNLYIGIYVSEQTFLVFVNFTNLVIYWNKLYLTEIT